MHGDHKMKKILAVSCVVLLGIQGCTPIGVAAGAGAAVGTAASREGGIGQGWSDTKIHAYIADAWFRYNVDMYRVLELNVREGRVLITGRVQNPQWRVDAVRLAWQAPSVRQVINEIRVENSEGVSGYARDSWIDTQLKTKLIVDSDVRSIDYNFDCVGGVVYLMGIGRDQEELDRVIAHAREIPYVKEVVSYVRLRTDVRPNDAITEGAPPAN
jgi:osmotically-inducible protein OsmY